MTWWNWILVHVSELTGTSSSSSRAYNFWSGFGGDLGGLAFIGGVLSVARKHTCHTRGCWRWGHHEVAVDGVTYRVCRKCHPTAPRRGPSREDVRAGAAA